MAIYLLYSSSLYQSIHLRISSSFSLLKFSYLFSKTINNLKLLDQKWTSEITWLKLINIQLGKLRSRDQNILSQVHTSAR